MVICISTGASGSLGAQTRQRDSVPVIPAGLEHRVATDIASRWNVPVERVVLAWGWIESPNDLREETEFEIRGGVDNTRFVIVFGRHHGPPMVTRMQAGVRLAVPVAARPLLRGDIVDSVDLEISDIVTWRVPDMTAGEWDLPIGWQVRTSIARGDPVQRPAAWPPPAVQAGQTIQVVWSRGPVHVVMAGTALNRAREGQRVRVRLDGGRGNVSGIVTAPGNAQFSKRER